VELSVTPVSVEALEEYSKIPIHFEVRSTLEPELIDSGRGGILLHEKSVPFYVKDYDAMEEEGLARWLKSFDTSNWSLFLAREGSALVGGATVAFRSPGLFMLGNRDDIAVLWDIRVLPERRRTGIGTALVAAAAQWARGHDCRYLKIETQNNNVPACRFYAAQGCRLGEINRFAYSDPRISREVMLCWYLDL
jgi:GNAT superfamily N-acetyltransferase